MFIKFKIKSMEALNKKKLSFMSTIFLVFFSVTYLSSCNTEHNNTSYNSNSNSKYSEPKQTCKISTSKIRRMVRSNWRAIQRTADFIVSDKGSFEIRGYKMDGDELVVDIYSRGFFYDISFTVSFDAYFDDDCDLEGEVLDCYNYKKL